MADILVADHQHHAHRHSRSIGGLDSGHLRATAPRIEMVANPAFAFPMKHVGSTHEPSPRPTSMLLPSAVTLAPSSQVHRRAASELPQFSFNKEDVSGRRDDPSPLKALEGTALSSTTAATKHGHRRGGSEFVGGDSRFGVSNAISSSPTKTSAPQLPLPADAGSPAKRRSHAHRRSVAVSSHDLSQIMSAGDRSPRLSSSLPSSPMEMPIETFQRSGSASLPATDIDLGLPEQGSRDESPVRPVSRPRVEFSEEVEIIPRPLSTISSETESSFSTVRGHSINDSISSVLSLGTTSPASPRARGQQEPALASIVEPKSKRSSLELSRRLEREGEWLKSRSAETDAIQSSHNGEGSTPTTPTALTFEQSGAHRAKRQKRQSLGQTFGFDRRRSEPAISVAAGGSTKLAGLSLQESHQSCEALRPVSAQPLHERRFSGQRLKQWVSSKLHRKSRESIITSSSGPFDTSFEHSDGAELLDVPGESSATSRAGRPIAETDLDAVFGALDDAPAQETARPSSRLTFDTTSMPTSYDHQSAIVDADDASAMLDLDAATEPLRTPPLGSSHRRQLHSDRASKQASSSGGFVHRRAESEPALTTFHYNRAASCSQKSMEDVFEEDEEDDSSAGSPQQEEHGMGITVVDADEGASSSVRRQGSLQSTRPSTSYISPTPRLFVSTLDRPASLIDEVIVEESSPVEEPVDGVEVVQAHEEPRAPSLEKLSDSSEASTLLGASLSALPDASDHASPTTLHSSAFSSPDLLRRQGSFEASRIGTAASSLADTRTTSSCTTGDGLHDMRMSVDDVPSLTSSRSTMLSMVHANSSARNISEPIPRMLDPEQVAARRKKRASIQSLSQLMTGPFSSKSKLQDESRPQTAMMGAMGEPVANHGARKKDNRLKKLMFWRSRQSLREAAQNDAHA